MGRAVRHGVEQRHRDRPARPLAAARAGGRHHEGHAPAGLPGARRAARHDLRPGVGAHGARQPAQDGAEPQDNDRRRGIEHEGRRVQPDRLCRPGGRDGPRGRDVRTGQAAAARQAGARADGVLQARLDARRGLHDELDPAPERHGDHRRARHAHLRRGPRAHERARERVARRRPRRGRRHRHHVPQPPRVHRGHRRGVQDRRSRALPQHRLRRPAAHGGRPAREAVGDRLRPGVHRAARGRGQAPQALHRVG